jgi:puromycin-sensitive aminopeptidase
VPDPSRYRLPDDCVPTRYDLFLAPDLPAGRFTGEETVHLLVRRPTREIVLNAAELVIPEASLQQGDGPPIPAEVRLDEAAERAVLRLPAAISPGEWRLRLRFAGSLNDKLRGFYRSRVAESGSPSGAAPAAPLLAVTQFEATEARRAFPCWDEPALKAVFQVSLAVDEGLAVIANTAPAAEMRLPDGRRRVSFAPTIPMSTYLVAFVVGRLEATAPVRVGPTPLRVWCVSGKERLAGFALEVAAFALRFFEEYYGLPYPGDKLDLIAIPDFAFGAMENLGAITFRETALLVDPAAATHGEQARVADVVAHELAHMWFGDLVTMAWWNGLWLNEAFATFMEVMAVDAWRPAWARWTAFGVSRAAALAVDGLAASRPVEYEVQAPRDADAMFDVLTYEKGGAVLRMLEQHLGPGLFREGVRRYLQEHRFGNADTVDLWRALGAASGQPIPAMMDGWIFRPGYPVVSVAPTADRRGLCLQQARFRYLEDGGAPETWQVPLTIRAEIAGAPVELRHLLAGREEELRLPGPAEHVVVNAGGHGFYRVRYAPGLLQGLLAAPAERLQPIERFNLVNDAWALAQAGALSVGTYLDLTDRFRDETDRNVWATLLASFAALDRLAPTALRGKLAGLVRGRLRAAVSRVGWTPAPDEPELLRQLRGELLRAAGTLGEDAGVQAAARDLAARGDADPNVLSAAIAVLAHVGGRAEFETFLERFRRAGTPQEEQRYLYALAAFRDPDLIRRVLAFALDGSVRTQDAPYLVRSLLLGPESREAAWAFVRARWDDMAGRYPENGLRRMCEGIVGLATPALEAEVHAFFEGRRISLGGKALEQYLEQLRIAVRFAARLAAPLERYLL